MAKYREVTVDGTVVGYVRNDARGQKIADDIAMQCVETASTRALDTIPQGARRLDLDQQVRSGGRRFR